MTATSSNTTKKKKKKKKKFEFLDFFPLINFWDLSNPVIVSET